MAGIYIPGMEMPKSCAECRFFVDAWCYAFEAEDWRNGYNSPLDGERLENCPLVDVPPHGDLVDRAEIKKDWFLTSGGTIAVAVVDIDGAKPIIPADKETNNG